MSESSSVPSILAQHYEIERELGRGGMATVYLARDKRHDREVAIKILSPDISHAFGVERFQREIAITARRARSRGCRPIASRPRRSFARCSTRRTSRARRTPAW